jgi:hypothetical protein
MIETFGMFLSIPEDDKNDGRTSLFAKFNTFIIQISTEQS